MPDIVKLRYYLSKIVEYSSDKIPVPPSLSNIKNKTDTAVIESPIDVFTMLCRNQHIRERLGVSLANNSSFEDAVIDILELIVDASKFARENEKNVSN